MWCGVPSRPSGVTGAVSRQVFIKSELKVGVVYVREGQYTEEEILENNQNSRLFDEFLSVLGDKVRLKGKQTVAGTLRSRHSRSPTTGNRPLGNHGLCRLLLNGTGARMYSPALVNRSEPALNTVKAHPQSKRCCGKRIRAPIQIYGEVSAVKFSSRLVLLLQPPLNVFE